MLIVPKYFKYISIFVYINAYACVCVYVILQDKHVEKYLKYIGEISRHV